jgi:hypothetical protein
MACRTGAGQGGQGKQRVSARRHARSRVQLRHSTDEPHAATPSHTHTHSRASCDTSGQVDHPIAGGCHLSPRAAAQPQCSIGCGSSARCSSFALCLPWPLPLPPLCHVRAAAPIALPMVAAGLSLPAAAPAAAASAAPGSVTTTASSTCLRWPAATTVAHTVSLQCVSRSCDVTCGCGARGWSRNSMGRVDAWR